VELYTAEQPDLVTVILSAKGFTDLLERGEFLRRVSDQDRKIVEVVRSARADAVATEHRLDHLEERQAAVTQTIQQRRDEVAAVKQDLIGTRVGYARTRAGKDAALHNVRAERQQLEAHCPSSRPSRPRSARRCWRRRGSRVCPPRRSARARAA
jgi:peptidoglycan hydrolase CwlO-like protein